MVDGLDAEPSPSWEGGDFATIVQQLRLLGFNAVRLPFQFSDLYLKKPQVCYRSALKAVQCDILLARSSCWLDSCRDGMPGKPLAEACHRKRQ